MAVVFKSCHDGFRAIIDENSGKLIHSRMYLFFTLSLNLFQWAGGGERQLFDNNSFDLWEIHGAFNDYFINRVEDMN